VGFRNFAELGWLVFKAVLIQIYYQICFQDRSGGNQNICASDKEPPLLLKLRQVFESSHWQKRHMLVENLKRKSKLGPRAFLLDEFVTLRIGESEGAGKETYQTEHKGSDF